MSQYTVGDVLVHIGYTLADRPDNAYVFQYDAALLDQPSMMKESSPVHAAADARDRRSGRRAVAQEPHRRLPVLGSPAGVGAGPVSRLHPQTGHDGPAEDQLRLGQRGDDTADRGLPLGGHALGSGAAGEQRGVAPV